MLGMGGQRRRYVLSSGDRWTWRVLGCRLCTALTPLPPGLLSDPDPGGPVVSEPVECDVGVDDVGDGAGDLFAVVVDEGSGADSGVSGGRRGAGLGVMVVRFLTG